MPTKRLFDDKSIKRILNDLVQDGQLTFEFYIWSIPVLWVGLVKSAPGAIVQVLISLLEETPGSMVIDALMRIPLWDVIKAFIGTSDVLNDENLEE